jgi:hypothetical protein
MIGMQYKISLPSDYNMDIIKTRIKENGYKTDGFKDLLFKCYLIQEKDKDGFENMYAPFYVWKDSAGMNKFIFDGYFDNIINSFGWQNINTGVPLILDLKESFIEAKYVLEIIHSITPRLSLVNFKDSIPDTFDGEQNIVGIVCIYNPDKWTYSQFAFYKERPKQQENNVYQILHISEG